VAEFVEEVEDKKEEPQQEEVKAEEVKTEPEIPEKYKEKTLQDVIAMHQEAEKLIGRQGTELGELRRVANSYVQNQPQTKQTEVKETSDDDFFANPKQAVDNAIQNHPKIREAEQLTLEMQRSKALSSLKEKHPDFTEIVKDQGFQDWIGNSKVRTELFARADRRYDYDAADELISTWKEKKQLGGKTVEMEKQARSQDIKSATTTVPSGSGEAPSKKIFRRSDIQKLIYNDPDKYEAMMPEIEKAYREGRVRG
tara:strand:+ start:880 stop:1641 length:762 start_codon:yes stop_codon:yes gene_type:complete